jgi:hypothetical protein
MAIQSLRAGSVAPIGRPSGALWTFANGGGLFLGFLVGFVAASAMEPLMGRGPWQSAVGYAGLGALSGVGVATFQWWFLHRHVPLSAGWIPACALGLAVAGGCAYGGAVLAFGYSEGLEDMAGIGGVLGWSLAAAAGGALSGLFQHRLLGPHLSAEFGWIRASSLAWGAGFALLATMAALVYPLIEGLGVAAVLVFFLVSLGLGGGVIGAATAPVLQRLRD